MEKKWVTVMGSFVADLAFRTGRIPAWGETLMGRSFKLGPGGKGRTPSATWRAISIR
jgi:ribokinase